MKFCKLEGCGIVTGVFLEGKAFNEFNMVAVPSQALARHLLNLSMSDDSMVNTAARQNRRKERDAEDKDKDFDDLVYLMELAEAVYRETQARILERFDLDAEASRLARERIHKRLAELEQERQQMIDRAVKLEDGRAVFLSEDGESIYTQDGERLSDDHAGRLLEERGDELRAGGKWEAMLSNGAEGAALRAEREALDEWDRVREEYKARVESGELTQEELEELEDAYEASVPNTVKNMRGEVSASVSLPDATTQAKPELSARFSQLASGEAMVTMDLPNAPERVAGMGAPTPANMGL